MLGNRSVCAVGAHWAEAAPGNFANSGAGDDELLGTALVGGDGGDGSVNTAMNSP